MNSVSIDIEKHISQREKIELEQSRRVYISDYEENFDKLESELKKLLDK